MTMIDTLAKKILLSRLPAVQGGTLTLLNEAGLSRYGEHDPDNFKIADYYRYRVRMS